MIVTLIIIRIFYENNIFLDIVSQITEGDEDADLKKFTEEVKQKLQRSFTKFLVHVSSQLDVDGKNGGSKISSWVDRNLHTLEEKRKELVYISPIYNTFTQTLLR